MPRYEFTEHAERDLDTITDHTLTRWGQAQTDKYLGGLEALAQSLATNPDLGVHRDSLFEGLICFPYISHILYYIKAPHGITIIRVLHKRMDPTRHLSRLP